MALQWRPGNAVGLDHALDPGQVLRQCPWLARFAGRFLFRITLRIDPILDGGNPFLGFGHGRLKVLKRQVQLCGVQFFAFRAFRVNIESEFAASLSAGC